jgi:dCTP deaminase
MAILSDKDIKKLLDERHISIEPLDNKEKQIQPSSVDLRIGDEFKVFRVIRTFKVPEGEAFIIHPNEFALATTQETVKLPDDIVARVEGRSSMGRLGVTMHVTAGYIDPGFEGKITLEISNIGAMPVALYPGQRVCQVVFETMTSPSEIPYGHPSRHSKYMGQEKPESSRIKMDYELNK